MDHFDFGVNGNTPVLGHTYITYKHVQPRKHFIYLFIWLFVCLFDAHVNGTTVTSGKTKDK